MHLTLPRATLHAALADVARAASAKTTLPILSHVLLTADSDGLTLRATNLELAITRTLPCVFDVPGRAALPARLLLDLLATLPDAPVTLALDASNGSVRLTCQRARATVRGLDPEDFPALSLQESTAAPLDLPAAALRAAIDAVLHAVAPDESRPVLAGVLLSVQDDALILAAADGYRLAEAHVPLIENPELFSCIIPGKALAEVAHLLGDTADSVTLTLAGTQAAFTLNGATLHTRTIEGQFPDYQKIIPPELPTTATVLTSAFKQAVRAASVFGNANSLLIELAVTVDGLTVSSAAAEVGDQSSTVDCTLDGPPLTVALNARYLRDALDAITTDDVQLRAVSDILPVLLQPAGDTSQRQIIMPMQRTNTPSQATPEAVGAGA